MTSAWRMSVADRYIRYARVCTLLVIAIALLGWLGWWLGVARLYSIVPGWASMKPVTALGITLLGTALYLQTRSRTDQDRLSIRIFALVAMALGVQTLAEYALNTDFGLDSALLPQSALAASSSPYPGRMSHASAVEMILIGVSLFLVGCKSRMLRHASQGLSLLALAIAGTALIGYMYGVTALYSVSIYSTLAFNTTVAFLLLCIGQLANQPLLGFMTTVTSERLGGTMARRMLPLAILIPLSIGWLRLLGQQAGLYTTEFGLAMFAMSNVVIFSFLTLVTARSLNTVDMAHEQANERFHLAVEAAPNAMLLVDHSGIVHMVNRRAEKMFGYEDRELLGKPLDILIPSQMRGKHPEHLRNYFRNPVERPMGTGFDLYGVHKDGRQIPVEIGLNPIEASGTSNTTYVLASIVDISERKRSEQARAHLAAIVQSSEDVIISKTLDGFITTWNYGAERLFGYTAEEAIGKHVSILIPPELQHEEQKLLNRLSAGEYIAHYETVRLRKDGSQVEVALTISPIFDERGIIVGASKIAHDITDRIRSQQQLRESEERFRQLAENIQEVFWITSADKRQLLYVSPVFSEVWGRSTESLYALPQIWIEAVHPDDRQRVVAAISHQAEGTYDEEYRIVRPDQSVRWIHDRAYPVFTPDGTPDRIVGVAIDITTNRKLEEQLRESQKMEAIGLLAGGIAHDFNNLLSIIAGNAQLAGQTIPADNQASLCLREITRASTRATDLVRRILTFSRQQRQELKQLSLQPVVEEAIQFLRATLPTMVEIRTDFEPVEDMVLIDPTQIHQVIMNLGTNASYAMRERGILGFRIASVDLDEPAQLANPDLEQGRYLRLSVSDNGSGMDDATKQRIFEPFFTTKPHGEGTGLGLSVVHGIMKSHNGTITVYSSPGNGTVFHLYFPAQRAIARVAETAELKMQRGNGQHILYVDDEEPLVFLGKRMLESLGYRVSGFSSPLTALETFKENPDGFDLVVSDLSMPHMSGTELAEKLMMIRRDLPVILATGYIRPGDEVQAAQIGIKALILKPNTVQELGTVVHQLFSSPQ